MTSLPINLGVDIGGTFTDVVLERGDESWSIKVLTTYGAPEDAILDGIAQVCAKADVAPGEINRIIHGTTLATNALIERRGAKTALVTTKGFRDVIEMRTESRFEQYDLNLVLPEALIPREDRHVLDERIGAKGQVLRPLDRADVEALAANLRGYDSIAIGLMHAYANPAHERLVAEVFAEKLPNAILSLSSEVSPQMREYERFNTVAANAYVKPLMKAYLDRLVDRLGAMGVGAPVYLMHSGGGIIGLESAAEFPVRLVESGPAGGAIFAAHIASGHGLDRVLSFDMGGTTAKICLIKDMTPKTSRVFEVARTYRFKKGSGMPISIPVIDMVEIGAGGGSLAHVDVMRQIRVGPESAGSEPGPACYERGGERPAVTDADLVLGRLDPDDFAGGSIALSTANSESALTAEVGDKLAMDPITAAYAVSEVVDETMANAARAHAVENGEDLGTYTMIAFGGAAPIHAGRLAEKLGVDRVLVPPGAGVGSAIGFLRAPFSFEATRSTYLRLSEFSDSFVASVLDELRKEASDFVRDCEPDADLNYEVKGYFRYVGQGWEIPVDLPATPDHDTYRKAFEDQYQILFGRVVHGLDIEITSWSVRAATEAASAETVPAAGSATPATTTGSRDLFDAAAGAKTQAGVIHRDSFATDQTITGPAVVTERETTIIVPKGFTATMRADGCIDLRRA